MTMKRLLSSKKWGYAASVALLPYAVLKTLWAHGVVLLATGRGIEELHASMKSGADPISAFLYARGIDITAVLALMASVLAAALVQEWGRRVPHWLLLVPAGMGGMLFFMICLITFCRLAAGTIRMSDTPEFDPWVLLPVYGGFFIWGIAISMAALSYWMRTRHSVRSQL